MHECHNGVSKSDLPFYHFTLSLRGVAIIHQVEVGLPKKLDSDLNVIPDHDRQVQL